MEVLRTRLCEWRPAGIDSIALAPAAAAEPQLAVGRSNGVVELWNTSTWHLHASSAGHTKRSIRNLLWLPAAEDDSRGMGRLVSAGLHREITEWNVATLEPLVSLPSGGGPVWALSAHGTEVYAACEDGTVRIFDAKGDAGDMQIKGRLAVGNTRLLSVTAFGERAVFAGGSNSRIAKWSLATKTCDASMCVEQLKGDTLVWALVALGDHGLASADSLGLVHIWDPVTCVALFRFAQHQADVLCLAASEDGNVLLAGGVDAKIATFAKQTEGEERWVFRNADFGHTHDVRAMVLDGAQGLFVSGGVAGALRVSPLRLAVRAEVDTAAAFEQGRRRVLRAPFEICGLSPALQTASVAQSSRLMLCQHDEQLELWYLQQPKPADPRRGEGNGMLMPEAQHVLKVSLEGAREGRQIGASAIAPDGGHFAASDEAGTRVFSANIEDLQVRRVKGLPAEVSKPAARALLFCSTSLLAIAPRARHELLLLDVARPAVAARFEAEHRAPIFLLASEGEWLASADLDGEVHVFSLDSLQHHARVPVGGREAKGKPTALCFDAGRHRLIIALSTHMLIVYDVEAQALAATVPSLLPVPKHIVARHERICGVAVPPGTRDKLLIWGHTFLARVDLASAATDRVEEPPRPQRKKRRKSKDGAGDSDGEGNGAWRAYEGFQHIVALCGLEESQWGSALLPDKAGAGAPQQIGGKRRRSGAGGGARAMALTMEVEPGAIQRSLPPAFERRKYESLDRQRA